VNPYRVLKIDREASKREIISAAALAMRERKFTGREIAEAQRELLDPVSRAAHDFMQFIDPGSRQESLLRPAQRKHVGAESLERLTLFDEVR